MINYLEVDDLVEIASIVLGETPQVRDVGLLSSAMVRGGTLTEVSDIARELRKLYV
ncbi:hypothetical protein [Micromonospora sp. NPDC006431]|uniref:hypothetical protein n=1 Tax=unclassified Micromonospora TaxID=2617518 RepID=UPI0036BD3F8E